MLQNISLSLFQNSELLSIILVSLLASIGILFIFHFLPERTIQEKTSSFHLPFMKPSTYPKHYTKVDWRNLILLVTIYSIISFWRLGSPILPDTTWQPTTSNQEITLRLTDTTSFNAIYTIYGEGDNNSNPNSLQIGSDGIKIYGSNDLNDWDLLTTLDKTSYEQYKIDEGNWNYQYIKLIIPSINQTLSEIGFYNNDHFLPVTIYQDDYSQSKYPATLLIDEQNKLVASPTYYDQGYFDEVYHPRNAWEIANGQYMYATVHPLAGTNLIALSIKLFGNNPLVWRLPGAIFGSLILIVLYALTHLLFSSTALATIATFLGAMDFMHLTTSRIATLEPFSIFWILLMFYYMVAYCKLNFFHKNDQKRGYQYLAIDGILMGIAISTKWTACYSAVGLAILLFTSFIICGIEAHHAKQALENNELTIAQKEEAQYITHYYFPILFKTILWCCLFFLIIPAIIYVLSYLPDPVWRDGWSIANVLEQNQYMVHYHTTLNATHPYQSSWYQWIIDARPIFYYFGQDSAGLYHSISCFSNPLLTWLGLPAILYTLYRCIKSKQKFIPYVILIGYITALGPWILFVKRCVFAYHFYPTSFFTILAITYLLKNIHKTKYGDIFITIYLIFYALLFMIFLPVTAGFGSTLDYIRSLTWLPGWYFG